MRDDAIAWCASLLLAADFEVRRCQAHFNLRGCDAGQLDADGDLVFRLTEVNRGRPACARHRNFSFGRLLQRSIQPPDAITQALKLDSSQTDVRSFNHKNSTE